MDIEQIDIGNFQAFQGFIDRMLILIFTRPRLGGKEDSFSWHAACLDASSNRSLIDISIRGIDQAASHLQRFFNTILGIRRSQHKGSDAHCRTSNAIVQSDVLHLKFSLL